MSASRIFELADRFAQSEFARDWVVYTESEDPPREYPNGKWYQVTRRCPNGDLILRDRTPLEVKGAILSFLRTATYEITSRALDEIEKLARVLVLQRGDA